MEPLLIGYVTIIFYKTSKYPGFYSQLGTIKQVRAENGHETVISPGPDTIVSQGGAED
jgi:hypothetical protein